MSIASFLDRSVDVRRETVTPSDTGGAVRTFATVVPGLACAAAPADDRVVASYQQRQMRVDYTVWTTTPPAPAGFAFQLNDQLAEAATGRTYTVLGSKVYQNGAVLGGLPLHELHCQTNGA